MSSSHRSRRTVFRRIARHSHIEWLTYGRVYVDGDAKDDTLYALDAENGDPTWKRSIPTRASCSPAVADGTVYYGATRDGSEPARLWALDAVTDETVWTYDTDDGSVRALSAVADGTVYVPAFTITASVGGDGGSDGEGGGRSDGRLYAVDAATGEKEWVVGIERNVHSSPAVADGL
jgi:outer membrane protein assembly factor BamB